MSFSKIEVITSMNKLSGLKKTLSKMGVSGMTVFQVIGCGVEKGSFEYVEQQNEEMELLPKQLIMMVVEDTILEEVIETIKKELYTGHIGDGKIFVSSLTNVIRVRTGEEGVNALK